MESVVWILLVIINKVKIFFVDKFQCLELSSEKMVRIYEILIYLASFNFITILYNKVDTVFLKNKGIEV